jgi:hypothetical protein
VTVTHFIDAVGQIDKFERTPQGGYVLPATIAREGLLGYTAGELRRQGLKPPASFKDSDMVQVYNPPDVVRAAVDSVRRAPVTREHPPRMVSSENWRMHARGHTEDVRFEGGFLKANLVIQDAELIRDIEDKKRSEVSMGYGAITEFTPGKSPSGESYDAVRTYIEYNHSAVVRRGRAGAKVCIALDSSEIPDGDPAGSDQGQSMGFRIKGAEVAAEKAQEAFDSAMGEASGEITGLKAALKAANDALAAAQAKLAAETSDAAIDAKVKAEIEKRAAAEAHAKNVAAVKDAYPDVTDADLADAGFVRGLLKTLSKDDGARAITGKGLPSTKAEPKATADAAPARPSARDRMLARNRGLEAKPEPKK